MKGFKAEPGEFTACAMSLLAEDVVPEVVAAADVGQDLAGRRVHGDQGAVVTVGGLLELADPVLERRPPPASGGRGRG